MGINTALIVESNVLGPKIPLQWPVNILLVIMIRGLITGIRIKNLRKNWSSFLLYKQIKNITIPIKYINPIEILNFKRVDKAKSPGTTFGTEKINTID